MTSYVRGLPERSASVSSRHARERRRADTGTLALQEPFDYWRAAVPSCLIISPAGDASASRLQSTRMVVESRIMSASEVLK